MLARTPVAKAFRKWVLDILDRIEGRAISSPDAPVTPDQQNTLMSVVRAKVRLAAPNANKGLRMSLFQHVWTQFNNHFRLAKYNQLPQCKMSEALEFLVRLEMRPPRVASKPREIDIVEGTPDFDSGKLSPGYNQMLKIADEVQAGLATMERLMLAHTRCEHSIDLDEERMLFVRNAIDLVQIARINLKSCEYALRSYGRIRSRVSFYTDKTD